MDMLMSGLMIFVIIGDLIAYLPQIIKILKTKQAEDLSIFMWILWTSTSIAEIIYYIYIGDIWLILMESCCMACNLAIFILSIKYCDKNQQKHIKSKE